VLSTLAGHLTSDETAAMLDDHTVNVVVMQEQSQIPSLPELVAAEMVPAATELAVSSSRHSGARSGRSPAPRSED
jgi:hypothetical protein